MLLLLPSYCSSVCRSFPSIPTRQGALPSSPISLPLFAPLGFCRMHTSSTHIQERSQTYVCIRAVFFLFGEQLPLTVTIWSPLKSFSSFVFPSRRTVHTHRAHTPNKHGCRWETDTPAARSYGDDGFARSATAPPRQARAKATAHSHAAEGRDQLSYCLAATTPCCFRPLSSSAASHSGCWAGGRGCFRYPRRQGR